MLLKSQFAGAGKASSPAFAGDAEAASTQPIEVDSMVPPPGRQKPPRRQRRLTINRRAFAICVICGIVNADVLNLIARKLTVKNRPRFHSNRQQACAGKNLLQLSFYTPLQSSISIKT